MRKEIINLYISILGIIAYYLASVIFLFIFTTGTLHLFITTDWFLDPNIFHQSYKIFLFTIALSLIFLSWIIEIMKNNISFIPVDKFSNKIKLSYIVTSVLLASLYRNNYPSKHSLLVISFLVAGCLFYILTPQLIQLYLKFPLKTAWVTFYKSASKLSLVSLPRTILLIIGTFIVIVSVLIMGKVFYNVLPTSTIERIAIRRNFSVTHTFPSEITHAEVVRLKGYNLGWGTPEDHRFRLLTSNGQISQITEWTENTITFVVPLHLKLGTQYIWVERPIDATVKNSKIIRTNKIPIHVYSRFDYYPAEGENKFQRGVKKVKKISLYYKQLILNFYKEL